MKSQKNIACIAMFTLCIVLMFVMTIMLWHQTSLLKLTELEVAELQSQLQEEKESHQADLRLYNNKIAELSVEVACLQEENITLRRQVAILEGLLGEVPEEALNLSDADKVALLKVAMSEAGNQGVIGKALVMRVVLNRVKHPDKYADNAEDVILSGAFNVTQPGGGYWTCVPDWECYVALFLIEHGWDESNGVLYFTSVGYSAYGDEEIAFQYKDHYFN